MQRIGKTNDQAQIGMADLDAEGCYLSANSSYLSMLGVQEADLLGRHWTSTVQPGDHGRVEEAYRLARTNGRGHAEIKAIEHSSGIVHQALAVTGVRDEKGAFAGYTCVRHQISDCKRHQEALTLAVESSPNGVLMLNTDGVIQFANRAIENLFGYSRHELVGRAMYTLLPTRLQIRQVHTDALRNSESVTGMGGKDRLGLRKDGVEIPLQVHVNRIATAVGELILCTVIDIAERIRHEQQLELAKQAAEAASRAKSDFLARMSHEIRTPMNLIIGMNALLLESDLTAEQRQRLEISYRNARRLLRLINGILDLSKVESGMLTLESAPFDLDEVMGECAAIAATMAEQKGLRFEMSVDPSAARYWQGDAERLHQILLNLVGNSAKFTGNGSIAVKVQAEPGDHGPGLRFEVSDTGCGIPPDKRALVFEAFQQADGAMNRPYEGTGLGLSIAKTLVEMMGGRIWIEDQPMPGTRVVFTSFFPPCDEAAVRERKSAGASARVVRGAAAGTRVLVVEDNPENVILLRAYLDKFSFSLDFASNGVEAIERRKQASYDLILMDVQMPVMDGYTATREIRAWEKENRAPRVPIVALTAHALSGAAAESIEAGCDGHVTKPVEQGDLMEAIAKFAKRPIDQCLAIPDPIAAKRPAFVANRRLDLTKMKTAFAARDFATIKVVGHNCKGIGAGYGFPQISRLGSAIEKAAIAQDTDGLEESLRQFESCMADDLVGA
jgi:PAS domain S-box-containing protein